MVAPSTISDFTEVVPGKVYGTADIAALMGVHEDTVLRWVKAGKIPTLPRISRRSPHRVLGASILSLLGERANVLPGPVETLAERRKRAAADIAAIRTLAKAR